MSTQVYKAKPFMNIRETVEKAIVIAHGINSDVIVVFNDARFAIKPNTSVQDAINIYLAARDKMTKTQQQLKEKEL